MEEKRETSSGLSSEPPPSITELSGEKRDDDGSEEKDELGSKLQRDLDSDLLAKASSVSKDDDGLVANALPETRTVKDDNSNRETQGVLKPTHEAHSVLKPTHESVVVSPRDASVPLSHPPHQMSESMRQWNEIKRNGFLSGALGGPVASSRPRKSSKKRRGDSSTKKTTTTDQVPNKKKDQHVTNAPPSGLLTGLKPGIIKHVRSKEQVYSVLEGLIRNADLNVRGDSARRDVALASSKLPSTTVSDDDTKSIAVEAATVASQWLDFLHQDLSTRLSAVQESRNRVDDTLKAELPLVVSSKESSSANQESSTPGDVSSDKTVTEEHQMKWSAKFEEYKKHLRDEEKDLETALNQVKDMQSQCNEGLRQMEEASLGKDGTNQETNLAVQAAAASIFSTCRFLLSKMKEATA